MNSFQCSESPYKAIRAAEQLAQSPRKNKLNLHHSMNGYLFTCDASVFKPTNTPAISSFIDCMSP